MEYEESYRGQRIIVTTAQHVPGSWNAKADLPDSRLSAVSPEEFPQEGYPSEEAAKRAALSAAAGAIDRSRTSRGKP
jgi:hypothetical protein